MERELDVACALALGSVASPGWKKQCFLKTDRQKHLAKWPLETQISSQIITFEWKVQQTQAFFNVFCKNHSFCNESERFPTFASRWLPDAASWRLAKTNTKTDTKTCLGYSPRIIGHLHPSYLYRIRSRHTCILYIYTEYGIRIRPTCLFIFIRNTEYGLDPHASFIIRIRNTEYWYGIDSHASLSQYGNLLGSL